MTPALDHLTRQVKALRDELRRINNKAQELSIKNKYLEDVLGPDPPPHPHLHGPPAGQGDGWMLFCASLVAAYLNEDWEGCRTLCDTYCRDSTFLRSVASMQMGIMWQ